MENAAPFGRMKKFFEAYEAMCKPYCQELGISVQAFEILMYIARRELCATAQDICKAQNIKPTLMSFHIEKLVQAGFVERKAIDGNRRSVSLVLTDAAAEVVKKGKEIYEKYTAALWSGVSAEEKAVLFNLFGRLVANADRILEGEA